MRRTASEMVERYMERGRCRTKTREGGGLGVGWCGGAGVGSRLQLTEACLCGGIIGKDRACRAGHVRIVGLNAKRLCVRLLVRCFFQVLEIGVDLCMGQRRDRKSVV